MNSALLSVLILVCVTLGNAQTQPQHLADIRWSSDAITQCVSTRFVGAYVSYKANTGFFTLDGGEQWNQIIDEEGDPIACKDVAINASGDLCIATTDGRIMRSDDLGLSWSTFNTYAVLTQVKFSVRGPVVFATSALGDAEYFYMYSKPDKTWIRYDAKADADKLNGMQQKSVQVQAPYNVKVYDMSGALVFEQRVERREENIESGEWRVVNGEWRVVNGEWRVVNGEWRVVNGAYVVVKTDGMNTESKIVHMNR